MDSPLFVGSNVAVLVAALEAAESGRQVVLLTDGRRVGGHFAGLRLEGHAFDVGMVLLEKAESPEPVDDLPTYRPDVRNDWTRFGASAARWLESVVTLRRTPTPTCLLDGRVWPDYLLANRLDALAAMPFDAPTDLDRKDQRHAANKALSQVYDHLDYARAAALNHGAQLHAHCIEPFVRKLLGVGSEALLARYHRAAWVPLFYPETVAAALAGRRTGLAEYPFWTTESGFVGDLVREVRGRLAGHPLCTVVEEPLATLRARGEGVVASVEDGRQWSGERPVLGLPLDRCQSLLGLAPAEPGPAASVTLLFCLAPGSALRQFSGCLSVVDESFATYRVSDQDALAGTAAASHRVVVEASPTLLAQDGDGEPPDEVLLRELRTLLDVGAQQAVRVLKVMTARNAIGVPTREAVSRSLRAHEQLSAAVPGAVLTGALLGYGATSLNDQIVQGLQATKERR
jgi:hypothetical protein